MSLDKISIDDKIYIAVEDCHDSDDHCKDCGFDNNPEYCRRANKILDCAELNVHFVPESIAINVDLRSATQQMQAWNPDAVEEQIPGTKYDSGKLQYTLVPPYALQEVARNLTAGLKKYKERNNWQKVPEARQRYMDALMRHFEAIRRGEIIDHESTEPNMSHMSAVAVNAMFLLEFMYNPELQETKEIK